jgi:cytochrome c peroxidase
MADRVGLAVAQPRGVTRVPGVLSAIVAVALGMLLAGQVQSQGAPPTLVPLSDDEVQRILAHGPWPVPWKPDPSNRVSGKLEAMELGERLFFERRLSGDGKVACATCHMPERRWADGRAQAVGRDRVDRNTPHLNNVRLNRWFGWDGAADSLWAQSILPILDPRELGANTAQVAALMRTDPDLRCRYEHAFGRRPSPTDDEEVLADIGKALASFQETLGTGRTPFDEFRDALARGDRAAASRYPLAAQRGAKLFVGKAGCNMCHVGPNFSNGEFHAIGVSFFAAPGRVDVGRYGGIKKLGTSPFNLLGRHSDDLSRASATSTKHVVLEQRNYGEFRTPSLRNAAVTAPFMHDGQIGSLRDVIRHYSELNPERLHADGEAILKPLKLSEQETDDLIVFIESLTNYTDSWWATPAHAGPVCR